MVVDALKSLIRQNPARFISTSTRARLIPSARVVSPASPEFQQAVYMVLTSFFFTQEELDHIRAWLSVKADVILIVDHYAFLLLHRSSPEYVVDFIYTAPPKRRQGAARRLLHVAHAHGLILQQK
jgi:hypothetical protein